MVGNRLKRLNGLNELNGETSPTTQSSRLLTGYEDFWGVIAPEAHGSPEPSSPSPTASRITFYSTPPTNGRSSIGLWQSSPGRTSHSVNVRYRPGAKARA